MWKHKVFKNCKPGIPTGLNIAGEGFNTFFFFALRYPSSHSFKLFFTAKRYRSFLFQKKEAEILIKSPESRTWSFTDILRAGCAKSVLGPALSIVAASE